MRPGDASSPADHVDWHQVAKLLRRGCPPRLVLRIVRRYRTDDYSNG
jgi:hypothetical protein